MTTPERLEELRARALAAAVELENNFGDLVAKGRKRKFDTWFAGQFCDEDGRFDRGDMEFAFEAGMLAQGAIIPAHALHPVDGLTRCRDCTAYWRANPRLADACAAVGTEHGEAAYQVIREYLNAYHERGHREAP